MEFAFSLKADKKKIFDRMTFLVDVKEAVKDADIIIEAVPEIMDLKKRVLKEALTCHFPRYWTGKLPISP